jgi:hypothetical protein
VTVTLLSQGAAEWLGTGWDLSMNATVRLFGTDMYSGLTASGMAALDETDFVEPVFPGYAALPVTSGGWTYSGDGPTTATYSELQFDCTGVPAAGIATVHGYVLERDPDSLAIWFEVFTNGPFILSKSGESVKFQPQIAMD